MRQDEAFLKAGGNVWYDINRATLGQDDPVSDALGMLNGFNPAVVVELGCANGWRLKKLRERYDCIAVGIDPSINAIDAGMRGGNGNLFMGTARDLRRHVAEGQVDLLIYGYCLAFVDPDDYFQILADCDWALCDNGIVIIHDAFQARPIKSNYLELGFNGDTTSVWLHMMDFKRLWLAHPHYKEIGEMISERKFEAVTVLQKRRKGAFTVILASEKAVTAVYEE